MNAGLVAHVVAHAGPFDLEVDVAVADGETVALVGPNGAGKSTLLRALAGLHPLTAGRVALGDEVLADTATGTDLPVEDRPVGFVFQDHRLFPNLSILENVAFGPRARGAGRRRARELAAAWLDEMGLADRAGARPGHLSGGEAQRVALARALATEPRLLLLDEPLSALDASTRLEMRRMLRRRLAGRPGVTVVVTHDPVEAVALADRLLVLEGGRLVQAGTAGAITSQPRTRYVADLVGLNLWRGMADGRRVDLGGVSLALAEPASGEVFAVAHPRAVSLHRRRPEGTPRNVWAATVADVDVEGGRVRVTLDGPVRVVAEVTTAAVAELGLGPGAPVWVAVKATEIETFAV